MGKARNREKLIETLRADKIGLDAQLKVMTRKHQDRVTESIQLRAMCDDLKTGFKQALSLLNEMEFDKHYVGGFMEASYALLEKCGEIQTDED